MSSTSSHSFYFRAICERRRWDSATTSACWSSCNCVSFLGISRGSSNLHVMLQVSSLLFGDVAPLLTDFHGRLLYQPITLNCGHSFCNACLHRVLDFKPSCPQCRKDLSEVYHLFGSMPTFRYRIGAVVGFYLGRPHI